MGHSRYHHSHGNLVGWGSSHQFRGKTAHTSGSCERRVRCPRYSNPGQGQAYSGAVYRGGSSVEVVLTSHECYADCLPGVPVDLLSLRVLLWFYIFRHSHIYLHINSVSACFHSMSFLITSLLQAETCYITLEFFLPEFAAGCLKLRLCLTNICFTLVFKVARV